MCSPEKSPGRPVLLGLLLPLVLSGLLWVLGPQQKAEPATHTGKIRGDNVSVNRAAGGDSKNVPTVVDPRVELMSTIFFLAGNREYNRGLVASYKNDAEQHFSEFRDHRVVQLARQLRKNRGVSFDACMSMAIHVSDYRKLEPLVPFDHPDIWLDRRWRPDEAAEFLTAAREFVKESHFDQFLENHKELYATTCSGMSELLNQVYHPEWYDSFFGPRPQARVTVTLGLLNGGASYGPRTRTKDGKQHLHCIFGVRKTDADGLPVFDTSMIDTVVHEFCHSYANAFVDRHSAEFEAAGKSLFAKVETAMRRQAYGSWKTMMYETIVRACVIRYTTRYDGPLQGFLAGQMEKLKGFMWVAELACLLNDYETNRKKYSTLDDFAPRIIEFINAYAARVEASERSSQDTGP
jgi:hypothetical protein